MLKRICLIIMLFGLVIAIMLPTSPVVAEEDCVIPESGPWPPCATGGGSSQPTPPVGSGEEDCVIPESGPWPPCATGGGSSQPAPPAGSGGDDCVIPESGPWPPCATGGGSGGSAPAPTPAPDMPTPEPIEDGFRITDVDVLSKQPFQVDLAFDFAGKPDGFKPLIVVFDPDNCFDRCNQADQLGSYPIDGVHIVETGSASGTFNLAVDIDNLICPYQPRTERMLITMTDADAFVETLQNGGTVVFDVIGEFEMVHEWCE